MPPQQRQRLSQVSLTGPAGGGGGGGAQAILAGIAQEQARNQQKIQQQILKLQQANVEENAAARGAASAGVTEALNAVVAGQERRRQSEEKTAERAEDRLFAEESAKLQAELQKELQQDARRVGDQIQQQRQSALTFLDRFEAERDEVRQTFESSNEHLEGLLNGGFFDQFADGTQRYLKMKNILDKARAQADDHFSDDNIAEVQGLLNKTIRDINAGQPSLDLSNLRRNPLLIENPNVTRAGRATPDMDPETSFSMKMTNGYPENGILFGEEGPPEPEGREPKLLDPDTFKEVLFYDSFLTQMTDDRSRRRMLDMLNRTVVDANQRLTPMMEQYKSTNKLMAGVAPQAVRNGLREFMELQDPRKFNDVPRTLFAFAMRNVYPENGDDMANLALEVFDGETKLETAQDYWVAMGLESAAFNIQNFMANALLEPDEKGQTFAGTLVKQMEAALGTEEVAANLGLPPGTTLEGDGLVLAQRAMTTQLIDAKSFAERVALGIQKSSALEEFRRQFGKNVRMGDILSTHKFLTDEDDREKALGMIRDITAKGGEGLSVEQSEAIDVQQTPEFRASVNLMDAMLMTADQAGPDTLKEMAIVLSGGAEDITTPNFLGYQGINKAGRDRSPSLGDAHKMVTARRDRQKEAKERSIGQAFESGGVPGAVATGAGKAVAGVGKAAGAVGEFATRTGAGLVQLAGGKGAATSFVKGVRKLQGQTGQPQQPQQPQQGGQ